MRDRGLDDDRGRITIPDVIFVMMSLAFLGALWPVFHDLLVKQSAEIPTGAQYLYLLFLPFAILVLFSKVYMKAAEGLLR